MAIVFVHEHIIYLIPLAIRSSSAKCPSSRRLTLLRLARSKVVRRKGKGLRLRALRKQAPHARWVARHRAGLEHRRRGRVGSMVGIQRRLEGVAAVEEESAVVNKRVYHEQDGGTEARPQHRNACGGGGGGGYVGCVSRSVAPRQDSARRWPFHAGRRLGSCRVCQTSSCLSVGRRKESIRWARGRWWIFLVREVVAGGPESD